MSDERDAVDKAIERAKQDVEEANFRRKALEIKALQLGLVRYHAPDSRVWVDEADAGKFIPSTFYIEDYLNFDKPPVLNEYRIKYPITNSEEFVEAMRVLDEFFAGTTNIADYARHGLLNFLIHLDSLKQQNND